MVIAVAVVMGIIGGLVVKALFLKESHLVWDAAFGLVGGSVLVFGQLLEVQADVVGQVQAIEVRVVDWR